MDCVHGIKKKKMGMLGCRERKVVICVCMEMGMRKLKYEG